MDKTLERYLEKYDVKFIEHRHKAVFTVEEHDKLMGNTPHILHTKSLFLKDKKKNFYLVSMYAKKRLDMKKLESYLGVRKITFAAPEELKEKINLVPGSVSVFGAIYIKDKNVKLIIDKEVWDAQTVGFHPNVNTSTLEVSHEDLEKFYNSLKCDKEIMEL